MHIHDIELLKIIRLDADRSVCHVRVGKLYIKSLWITGISTGRPRVRWPETGKGYPIVEAEPDLKAEVDHLVLDGLDSPARTGHRPARPRRVQRPDTTTTQAEHFDDPRDDLFGDAP
jgi:hypothetical protein